MFFARKEQEVVLAKCLATMALPTTYSMVSSLALSILTFAGMQMFKDQLSTEGVMTILGGFVGSWFFVFFTTVIGNLGMLLFGDSYNVRLFPEVIISIVIAMGVSASVHRVCATTCLLFSLVALYYINRISKSTYASQTAPGSTNSGPQKPTSKKQSGKAKSS